MESLLESMIINSLIILSMGGGWYVVERKDKILDYLSAKVDRAHSNEMPEGNSCRNIYSRESPFRYYQE